MKYAKDQVGKQKISSVKCDTSLLYYIINYLTSHFLTFLHLEVWCYTCILFYSCKHFTYFCLQTKYVSVTIIYMKL